MPILKLRHETGTATDLAGGDYVSAFLRERSDSPQENKTMNSRRLTRTPNRRCRAISA
jgi:hypothetical protein